MSRFSESDSGGSHFIFFNEYEEGRFDDFVSLVLMRLNAKLVKSEQGPYSVMVTAEYEGCQIVLTSGSFEGCYISMDQSDSWLAKNLIAKF